MNNLFAIALFFLLGQSAAPVDAESDGAAKVAIAAESEEESEALREALKDIPRPSGATLSLEEMVNAVLDHSPDLKEAEQQLVQVRKSIGQVRAALIPTISVSGTLLMNSKEIAMKMPDFNDAFQNLSGLIAGTYEMKTNDYVMNPKYAAQFSGNITVPLFMGQVYPSLRQVRHTITATELTMDNVVQQLASGVVTLYGGALASQKVLDISKTAVKLAENHLKAAKVQEASGTGSPIQVTQAELALAQAVSQLVNSCYSYNQLLDTLSIMSGQKIGGVADMNWQAATVPDLDDAVQKAKEARLDFKIAEEQLVAAKKALNASKMAYAPNILGQASMSSSTVKNMNGDHTSFSAMLVASWTLLDGLARESKLGSAKAAVKEKEAHLLTLENNLRRELMEVINKLRQAQDTSLLMKKQVALAKTNFEAVEYSFNSGSISNLEYDDASANFNQAQLQEAATDIEAIMAVTALYYSLGNLHELLPGVNLNRFSK